MHKLKNEAKFIFVLRQQQQQKSCAAYQAPVSIERRTHFSRATAVAKLKDDNRVETKLRAHNIHKCSYNDHTGTISCCSLSFVARIVSTHTHSERNLSK